MANDEELDLELDTILDEGEEPTQEEPKDDIDWKATALRYKKKLNKVQTTKPVQRKDTAVEDSRLARLEMKIDGLSDEAIDFALANGGKESLKNPYVKAAIDAIQEQKRAEAAVVTNETSKSDIERKFSPEEINAMSAEEMYKILPKAKN